MRTNLCLLCLTPLLWLWELLRLTVYLLLVLPGCVPFCCQRERRVQLRYGRSFRHTLDVHLPASGTPLPWVLSGLCPAPAASSASGAGALPLHGAGAAQRRPVFLFFSGGGWVLGCRLWGLPLAQRLASLGAICVLADHRNFPCARGEGMVEDVEAALEAVFAQVVPQFGGEPERVIVVGQSAGAHLAACMLLRRAAAAAAAAAAAVGAGPDASLLRDSLLPAAAAAASGPEALLSASRHPALLPSPPPVHCFVGVAGVYDLQALRERLQAICLGFVLPLALGPEARLSPARLLRDLQLAQADGARSAAAWQSHFPATLLLLHGGRDRVVPPASSQHFAEALRAAGLGCTVTVLPGMGHAGPLLADLVLGDTQCLQGMLQGLAAGEAGQAAAGSEGRAPELAPITFPATLPACIVSAAKAVDPT